MSLKFAFGISLFLLLLVALNVYFFYTLVNPSKHQTVHNYINKNFNSNVKQNAINNEPTFKLDVFEEILDYLQFLSYQYRTKNPKFSVIQRQLISSFNAPLNSTNNYKNVWHNIEMWAHTNSLFPNNNGQPSQILRAMRDSQIALASNAPKGTQLKLLFMLENKQKLYFKPKRYNLDHVINGNVYAGFDRHNSEAFAYYLAMVMNFTWIPPVVIRRVNIQRTILPVASLELRKTMIRNNGSLCIYGKCFFCKINEVVCEDANGELEGAAILYFDKQLRTYSHPWKRSYNSKVMPWEKDMSYCKVVKQSTTMDRLLNLIDVAIFDFLIQNGDRHHYEVYKNKIVLLDNGKGLGNPDIDALDILAPLYQCCVLRFSTWQQLELLTGGSLTETISILASDQKEKIITDDNLKAIERRFLKVHATIQMCIGKFGRRKVFVSDNFEV